MKVADIEGSGGGMLRGVQQKKWKKKWVRNEPAFFAGR
jgi:hypothetical protein